MLGGIPDEGLERAGTGAGSGLAELVGEWTPGAGVVVLLDDTEADGMRAGRERGAEVRRGLGMKQRGGDQKEEQGTHGDVSHELTFDLTGGWGGRNRNVMECLNSQDSVLDPFPRSPTARDRGHPFQNMTSLIPPLPQKTKARQGWGTRLYLFLLSAAALPIPPIEQRTLDGWGTEIDL